MVRMHETSFDWLTWHGGSACDLGVPHRKELILGIRHHIRGWAIGWLEGDRVPCRPKPGMVAVMFLKDGEQWWTHLMEDEFDTIFPKVRWRSES